mmetsp:Transcript_924/g.1320  ORF Transcript_924/g.1320 Transcript_924/m.1320 type:complete len:480 (-) Transcript_924:281-1720(-)
MRRHSKHTKSLHAVTVCFMLVGSFFLANFSLSVSDNVVRRRLETQDLSYVNQQQQLNLTPEIINIQPSQAEGLAVVDSPLTTEEERENPNQIQTQEPNPLSAQETTMNSEDLQGILKSNAFQSQLENSSSSLRNSIDAEGLDEEALVLKNLREELCSPQQNIKPIDYYNCNPDEKVNVIKLFGGMCNALKFVLLGAIQSAEENRCFVVDEFKSPLNVINEQGKAEGFINKYFEPIGLNQKDKIFTKARLLARAPQRDWNEFWDDPRRRRTYGETFDLPRLGYFNIEGHALKRAMIRRLWRPLPEVRESTCKSLEHHDLGDEYMAFSVRRGDKTIEKFAYTNLTDYIDAAKQHFHRFPSYSKPPHIVPKIFVATDDCSVMKEFRSLEPTWNFISECDEQRHSVDSGFALSDAKNWGKEKQAAHFDKFFVEVYALTTAKVFIGVAYTNVSWWVFFLRPFRHSFILLDKPEEVPDSRVFDHW